MKADDEKRGTEGYETRDTMFGYLLLWGVGLTILVVAGHFVARGLLRQFLRGTPDMRHPLAEFRPGPEGPLLQGENRAQYEAYREEMRRATSEYAWIDTTEGIVRLPQERAFELALERGFETREER
ncbi:MAG: hypothetical protein WD226_07200 [Planctomycetota bacterium]